MGWIHVHTYVHICTCVYPCAVFKGDRELYMCVYRLGNRDKGMPWLGLGYGWARAGLGLGLG